MLKILLIAAAAALVLMMAARLRRPGGASRPGDSSQSSSEPYGEQLASRVAARLQRGDALCYGHREYGGMGLRYHRSQFIYGETFDGFVLSPEDLRATGTDPANIEHRVFDSRAEFVAWLAAQSDDSLSGKELADEWYRGNQRITRKRLESFARGERVPDA